MGDLDMHRQLCESTLYQLRWSSGKILPSDAGGLSSNPGYDVLLLFHNDILGSLGSNLVFIIPFGITY